MRCLRSSGPVHAQVGQRSIRAEGLRHGLRDRAELRLPVALSLHGLRVDSQRDVVHEHPAVDLGQVDVPFAAVGQRVQRPDDVVAVDPEVEREVVARPGRDAGVRQPVLGGRRGDDGLRAIAPGGGQGVGAAFDRYLDELAEVVARTQSTARCRACGPPGRGGRARPCRPPTSGSRRRRACCGRCAAGRSGRRLNAARAAVKRPGPGPGSRRSRPAAARRRSSAPAAPASGQWRRPRS